MPAAARKLAPAPITIDDALTDRNLLGAALGDMESWQTWRVILKAAFGLPLGADELEVFRSVAGARNPPSERVAELWIVAGRRSAKSRMAGALCAYLAAFSSQKATRAKPENRARPAQLERKVWPVLLDLRATLDRLGSKESPGPRGHKA